jgi:hypothetical protein
MHFSQTTSFSCILGRAVKSTARVQLGLNHDYKPETLQQKHLQCIRIEILFFELGHFSEGLMFVTIGKKGIFGLSLHKKKF